MNTDTRAITRRRLPIGMQTFRKVREEHCYYVDKTAYIRRLLDEGKHYFLSRPRRFGKSLFLDTCKELFEGNEPLFEGLADTRPVGLVGAASRAALQLRQWPFQANPGYLRGDRDGRSCRRRGRARSEVVSGSRMTPRRPVSDT